MDAGVSLRLLKRRVKKMVYEGIGDEKVLLSGKVAFIAGASDGMGKASSYYLSSLGVNVVMAARRGEIVSSHAKDIMESFHTDPLPLGLDVTSEGDVERAMAKTWTKYGRLDFVINFAGNPIGYVRGDRKKPIHEQTLEHMKEIAEVDHFGSVRILKHALPYMIRQKAGMIILISAITSVYGFSEDIDYIPYKRANEGLVISTALRSEREGWGVKLYALAPGDVFNPSTWNAYDEAERREAVEYGVIESITVAKIASWIFSGRLKKMYEMDVDIDSGKVLDPGRYSPLENGDIIVVDAKTAPRLFQSVGETYRSFVPEGYRD
jgi:NAD(P)-dependent dehydrogenase (short-subunit alcohol dehydrogenase family)